MEFGRLQEDELNNIDFSLPAEPVLNNQILMGKPAANPKVYVGSAKQGRIEWMGKIYPLKANDKDFLRHYTVDNNTKAETKDLFD